MSEPTPVSLIIIEAVEKRLRAIAPSHLYFTRPTVLLGAETVDEADLPAVVVWEGAEEPERADGSHSSMAMQVILQLDCLVRSERGCTVSLSRLRADVKRALLVHSGLVAEDGTKLGCLIYRGMQRLERPVGSNVAGFTLAFAAKFKEGYGDPSRSV